MKSLKPPAHLKLTGNVDSNWHVFRQRFRLYLEAVGLDTKPDSRRVALLLSIAGPEAIEVYTAFVSDEEGDRAKVLSKFDSLFS